MCIPALKRRAKGPEALRLLRRYMPRLRWCPNCGAPVLGRSRCPRCGGPTLEVKLAPPGDARPAWDEEKRETWRVAVEKLGREAAERLLGGPQAFWLFNPIQAVDAADEIIVDGHTVASRLYDPLHGVWRVRPDRVGVEILVEEELGPHAVVGVKLTPGMAVRARVRGGSVEAGDYVALKGAGPSYGVGKLLSGGEIRVVKAWYRSRTIRWVHRPRSLRVEDVAELNRGWLEEREEEALEWLAGVIEESGARPYASISGGKDSTVSAAIAAKAGVEEAYTVDTGVEHPESLETVERVASALGLTLHRAEAGDAFARGFNAYGPPARDYRWCTKLLKLAPLSRLFRQLVGDGRALMIVGQRGAESPARAAAGRLAESGTIGRGRHLVAAPIQEWSSLEVFLYIILHRLPLNPLYRLGFERIGCYMCPASHLAEFRVVSERHPDLWDEWMRMLYSFARRAGLPRAWADYGFWRWRFQYPAEARALAARLRLNPDEMLERLNNSYTGARVEYTRRGTCLAAGPLGGRVSLYRLHTLLKATGLYEAARRSGDAVTVEAGEAVVRVDREGRLEACGRAGRRLLRDVAGPLAMASSCVGCRLCVEACPVDAIKSPPPRIDVERCTSCRACVNVCPAGGEAAESIVWSLLRLQRQVPGGSGRGWRRG